MAVAQFTVTVAELGLVSVTGKLKVVVWNVWPSLAVTSPMLMPGVGSLSVMVTVAVFGVPRVVFVGLPR